MNPHDACCPNARLALATGEVAAKLETLPAALRPAFRRRLVALVVVLPLVAAAGGTLVGAAVAGPAGAVGTAIGFAITCAIAGLIRWYERVERIAGPLPGVQPARLRAARLVAGLGVLGALAGLALHGHCPFEHGLFANGPFESGLASLTGALTGVLTGVFVDQGLPAGDVATENGRDEGSRSRLESW